ncbi:hypothetical protein HanPSC8_Chr10g0431461 [Helianthus annuus]|nr:hypothetical protein HanPSC8_Chr10g0431461 [Helianthus annuus]
MKVQILLFHLRLKKIMRRLSSVNFVWMDMKRRSCILFLIIFLVGLNLTSWLLLILQIERLNVII